MANADTRNLLLVLILLAFMNLGINALELVVVHESSLGAFVVVFVFAVLGVGIVDRVLS